MSIGTGASSHSRPREAQAQATAYPLRRFAGGGDGGRSHQAWVQVRNSNHPGALGYYPLLAAEQGLIALAMSNASVSIAPWGGRKRMLGNNPMAIAVPVAGRRPLVYDIACSVAAQSQVRMAQEEGIQLPEGLAIDEAGNPTRDPAAANLDRATFGQPARVGHTHVASTWLASGTWTASLPELGRMRYPDNATERCRRDISRHTH